MATIEVTTSQFKGSFSNINGTRTVPVSKRRLLKFATNVGLPIQSASVSNSAQAVALAAYKALAIKSSVDFTRSKMGWPQGYPRMDPTEKANLSYWTGMAFASLLADELLGVARLMHASLFKTGGIGKSNPASRQLADLVGQDASRRWHVIEAKARQRTPSQTVRNRWKAQAQTISSINGNPPTTNSYVFTRVGAQFSVEVVAPPMGEEPPHFALTATDAEFVRHYYGPLQAWLSQDHFVISRDQGDLVLRRVGYDLVDAEFIYIGLTIDTMFAAREGVIPEQIHAADLDDAYIGSDGVVVLTSREPNLG